MQLKKNASNHLSECNHGLRKHEIKVPCRLISTPLVFAFIKRLLPKQGIHIHNALFKYYFCQGPQSLLLTL